MKPRIGAITLGVDDLEKSLKFYRDGLGLPTEGITGKEFENGAVAFFKLQPGFLLAIFPRESLAIDAAVKKTNRSSTEFSLGHFVNSEREVDELLSQAVKAGARLVQPARKTFWGGYAGYFQDPDDHLWEILHSPSVVVAD